MKYDNIVKCFFVALFNTIKPNKFKDTNNSFYMSGKRIFFTCQTSINNPFK